MSIDCLLFALPNKNIDYPALSLPALTASLRQRGLSVEQDDINVRLRHALLSKEGLSGIVHESIPYYAQVLCESEIDAKRLLSIDDYLHSVQHDYGFEALAEIKVHAQGRDYKWIFRSEANFKMFLELFKVNRALHYLIDVAVTCSYEHSNDYLTNVVNRVLHEILVRVLASEPKIVGISILDIQRHFSLRVIEYIRDEFNGKLVIGGADPTRFMMEYIQTVPAIDAVFFREAENSLPLYVEELTSGKGCFENVPGLVYREGPEKIRINEAEPVDMSAIPSPDFCGLPLGLYLTPAMPIQASRGCYWGGCRFCIHWNTYGRFRLREPAKVMEDIEALTIRHGTKYFHFTDDCLPIHKMSTFRTMLRLIMQSQIEPRWLGYLRFEPVLDKSVLREIYDAGGRVLEIGLESASQKVLKSMRKNIEVSVAEQIVVDAASLGCLVKLFMFHGFPGEELEDILKTIGFAERHIYGKRIRAFLPLRNRFELLRGSDIYEAAEAGLEKGIVRFWKPSGLFGLRAEYELSYEEAETAKAVGAFVDKVRCYMWNEKIYNTDDENVMLDLLVLDHMPTKAGWHCI